MKQVVTFLVVLLVLPLLLPSVSQAGFVEIVGSEVRVLGIPVLRASAGVRGNFRRSYRSGYGYGGSGYGRYGYGYQGTGQYLMSNMVLLPDGSSSYMECVQVAPNIQNDLLFRAERQRRKAEKARWRNKHQKAGEHERMAQELSARAQTGKVSTNGDCMAFFVVERYGWATTAVHIYDSPVGGKRLCTGKVRRRIHYYTEDSDAVAVTPDMLTCLEKLKSTE